MAKLSVLRNPRMHERFADCRNQGFFRGLSDHLSKAMEEVSSPTSCPERTLLFVEGEDPRGVYVLTHGQIKLSVDSAQGKTLILKVAEPGELLGLGACLLNQPHQVTAEARMPCKVSLIRRSDFMRLVADSEMCLKVAEHLSRQQQATCREMALVALPGSADLKIASLLLQITSSGRGATRNACELGFTHEELSQVIGTSRETVTRSLVRLRRLNIIEIQGARLTVRNFDELNRIAQGDAEAAIAQ